jgi:uncharacterized protein (DUF305 family)
MTFTNRHGWRWSALALTTAALLAGCGGDSNEPPAETEASAAIVQPGAPGEESRKLSAEEAAAIESPEHTPADVEFMQGMLHHHAQALEMIDLVPGRGTGRDIRLLSERMDLSQQNEIDQIEKWLKDRDEAIPRASEHAGDHGGELMPGMLTPAQMERLGAADGRAFNRLFLRSMIRHHEGALTMVRELVEADAGQEPEIGVFTRHVEADQGIEIARMQSLLVRRQPSG